MENNPLDYSKETPNKKPTDAEYTLIPNTNPRNNIADNPDFMKALFDFQYGETDEVVADGHDKMMSALERRAQDNS